MFTTWTIYTVSTDPLFYFSLTIFIGIGLWSIWSISRISPKPKCICTKTCICENPPKKGEERQHWHKVHPLCPMHTYDPPPNPNCKARPHGPFSFKDV